MQRDKYQYLRRAAMLEVYGMEPISFVRKLCVFDNCLNRETRFFNLRSVRMCDKFQRESQKGLLSHICAGLLSRATRRFWLVNSKVLWSSTARKVKASAMRTSAWTLVRIFPPWTMVGLVKEPRESYSGTPRSFRSDHRVYILACHVFLLADRGRNYKR